MILVGLGIRLVLSPITAHPSDMLGWFRWTQLLGTGVFAPTYYPPYPLGYVLWPFATLYNLLQQVYNISPLPMSAVPAALRLPQVWGVSEVPPPLFDLLIKLPFIISDVAVALLLYEFVTGLTGSATYALRASTLWFLNPITIWVTSGWGMFDSLPALFTVVTLVLIQRNKALLAGIALVIAFAFKLYPVLFVVPIAAFQFHRGGIDQKVSSRVVFFLGALGTTLVFYIPYTSQAASYLGGAALSKDFFYLPSLPSGYGLTYWSLSTLSTSIGNLVWISTVVVVVLQAVTYVIFLRRGPIAIEQLVEIMLAVILALFLGFRFIGANFVVWIIPLMAILVSTKRLSIRLFWAISFLAFLFSITDSLLPYYFLPLSPWIGNFLASSIQIAQPYRIMASGTFQPGLSVGTAVICGIALVSSVLFALVYSSLAHGRESEREHA